MSNAERLRQLLFLRRAVKSGIIGKNRGRVDDTIFHYVQSYTDGEISRAAFWELARFKHPTHQISFHTARALTTLTFERSYEVHA